MVGKARIEALSDGIFSIAMTLLVLKLDVPAAMHHSSNASMLEQLLAMGPEFATYVVTFLVAGGFWFLHHRACQFLRQLDGPLLWMNLIFLMFVALLPFSAGLMSHLLIHPVSGLFYFGNHLVIAALLNLQWHYALAKSLLNGPDAGERRRITRLIAAAAAVFLLLLIAAAIFNAVHG